MKGALVDTLRREGYYEVDSTTFAAWRRLRTHAPDDAPPAAGTVRMVGTAGFSTRPRPATLKWSS
jgi:hypothetical protein